MSRSTLSYYCTQLLVARVVAIRKADGEASHEEQLYSQHMNQNMFPTPLVLDEYFRSIGYFKTDNGLEFKIHLPNYNTVNWGKVDGDNHWMYENWSHPYVAACQIQADLRQTRTGVDRLHQIPGITPDDYVNAASSSASETSSPEPQSPGFPTANLLGWLAARKIHQEGVLALDNCDITEESFVTDGPDNFKLNMSLMRMTANILRGVKGLRLAPGPHNSKWGYNHC